MRALVAIMLRELRERWTLPVATFFFGFVPLVLVVRAGERPLPLAGVMAVPTAWVVAVMMGGSVIARDLGDGRLGFFFARPVPWWAISGGKLLAALVLTLVTPLAGALPCVFVEGTVTGVGGALRDGAANGSLALLLALLLGLVAFGHAAGVVFRSRSTWAAVDFLLFAGSVLAAVTLYRAFARLGVVGGAPPEAWGLAAKLLLVAAVPLAAAAAQAAFGRSDLRRGHRVLSLTFWGGALLWFAVTGGLLGRELAATPAEFAVRHLARVGSDGRFVSLFAGESMTGRGRTASFLLDTASGRFVRIPFSLPSFSPEGHRAAWTVEAPFWRLRNRGLDIAVARLDGPTPLVETVELDPPLPEDEGVGHLVLGAGGERVAIVQPHTLSVHELPSGRSLSRTAAADGDWVAAAFLPDGRMRALRRLRAVVGGPGRAVIPGFLEVVEMAGGVPSSRRPLEAVGQAFLASGLAGERILLHEPLAPRRVSLHDARSGQRLRVFDAEPGWAVVDAMLLTGGAVAVVEGTRGSSRLRLATDRAPDRLVELPAGLALIGGELPGGRLSVGLLRPTKTGSADSGDTLIVALASGEIVRREAGIVPALLQGVAGFGPPSPEASRLFVMQAGEIVRLDPDTGRREVVLPAPTPR
jgi:hypothetical protein